MIERATLSPAPSLPGSSGVAGGASAGDAALTSDCPGFAALLAVKATACADGEPAPVSTRSDRQTGKELPQVLPESLPLDAIPVSESEKPTASELPEPAAVEADGQPVVTYPMLQLLAAQSAPAASRSLAEAPATRTDIPRGKPAATPTTLAAGTAGAAQAGLTLAAIGAGQQALETPIDKAVANAVPREALASISPEAAPEMATVTLIEPTGSAPGVAAPLAPAASSPASAPRPHDFTTLVDRLVEARDTALAAQAPQTVHAAIRHAEFGTVSLRFETSGEGLAVAMSSADPDFSRSVQAAASAQMLGSDNRDGNAGQSQGQLPGQNAAQSQGYAQSQGQAQSQTRRAEQAGNADGPAPANPSRPDDEPAHSRRTGLFA
ncbi:MAG: hypothetical protein WCY11_05880 [Novosphingobium sp.]